MIRTGTLLVLMLGIATGTARADDSAEGALREGLGRLAEKVAKFIEDAGGEKAVVVGDFIAPPRLKASGGKGISQVLEAALKKVNIAVKDKAPFQILGQFTVRDEKQNPGDDFESVSLRLSATLLDRNDEELQKFAISIFGDASLQVTGRSQEFPQNAGPKETEERKREAIDHPHAVIVGSETRTTAESPFGVEVRVRQGMSDASQPRAPVLKEGLSFVPLSKGEEYIVRLHNRADFETAVLLTVDGLTMFAFSEEGNFGSQVLVPPGKFVDIPGWFVTKDKTDAFEITSYAKSAAASRGVTTKLGTITASFSAAWDPAKSPPVDEASPKSADTATGRGRQIEKKYVEVKRVVGRLRAVVSVRYDR